MKKFLSLSMLALLVIGCEQHDKNLNKRSDAASSSTMNGAKNYDADNTGKNIRDREMTSLTPGNQSEDEADITITKNIRRAIIDEEGLSSNAKNVKIITIKRVVTLRGPVNNAREKELIEQKAKQTPGVERVDTFLEITKNQ